MFVDYDPAKKGWYLKCKGKNGLTVNGKLLLPASPLCRLEDRSQLKIGDTVIYFLLPQTQAKEKPTMQL
jgi:predicted component of type VI protein secretion system